MFRYIFGVFAGFGVAGILSFFVLVFLMVLGYFKNLWDLLWMVLSGGALVDMPLFILRIVGAFVGPLGGFLGWFA